MSIPISSDINDGKLNRITIPDVTGMSNIQAALAYAASGFYILPVRSGSKDPGSIVGRGWPQNSTHDPDTIQRYWDCYPDAGIALHTGKSGVVAFDIDQDIDTLPEEFTWLDSAVFQSSNAGVGVRGHYLFSSPETFVSSRLKIADGTEVGDIRSGNTVIMAQPSVHARADAGGGYFWQRTGPVPHLPDIARPYLTAKAGGADPQLTHADADATLAAFAAVHTGNRAPKRLDAVVRPVELDRISGTRNAIRDALCLAAREARAGSYPWTVAIQRIETAAQESYTRRGEPLDTSDFRRLCVYAVSEANKENLEALIARANRDYGTDTRDNTGSPKGLGVSVSGEAAVATEAGGGPVPTRFLGTSAAELAQPVPPMRWLVRDVWPQRSAGVLAGEKKTFKTWNLQAMALAVSSGVPMLDRFEVPVAGPVLYLCGEGGRDGFANRHQIIAARYGISNDDLAGLPFLAEFDTDELGSTDLVEGIERHLDRLQPVLVVLDPLYAYHPQNVEASNLYTRGPMLARLRELIEGHAALAIGDHFKKNTSNAFDLDSISMAGVGQWADTWLLQRHRVRPDSTDNHYQLEVQCSTRRGGGRCWEIDWRLDRDPNPDLVAWSACDWTVRHAGTGAITPQNDLEARIMEEVLAAPWMLNRSTLVATIGGRRAEVLKVVKRLVSTGELVQRDPPQGGGGKAQVFGPGSPSAQSAGGAP